jgi:hypothetical protein
MESLADAMQPQQEMLSFLKFDGGDDAQTIQKECLDKLPKDAIILGILLNAGGFGDAKDKVKKQLRADTPGKTPGACSIAQSNLIGHAILVHLLLKSGKITSETRIVASGSEAAFATPMNLEKSSFEGILTGTAKAGIPGAEYGWIKAILALYWAAFARHNADVFVVTVSPGSVPTTNLLSQGGVMPVLRGLSKMAMWVGGSHSEQDAAKRYLDALLGNQHEQQSGSFWASRKGYVKDYGDVLQSDLKSAKFVGDSALQDKAWKAVNKFVSFDLN